MSKTDDKITELLDQSLSILEKDIAYLAAAVATNPLTPQSNKCLNDSIRTLLMASKGVREQAKDLEEDLSAMSDEELTKMAEDAIKKAKRA